MDVFSDHALLCSSDCRLGGFQLCHSLLHWSLCIILRRAGVYHVVKPPDLPLEHDDAIASARVPRLSRPTNILLSSWHSDRDYYVDPAGVSPARFDYQPVVEALR